MSPLAGKRIARVSSVPMFMTAHLKTVLVSLSEAGAHPTSITSDGYEIGQLREIEGLSVEIVEIARAPSLMADLKSLWNLYHVLRKGRFDVVHSTTPKAGFICALAAFAARVPVRLHTFTGQRWATVTGVGRTILKLFDKLVVALNSHVFADSPSQKRFLCLEGIGRESQISVVGQGSISGIDLKRFDKKRYSKAALNQLRRELGIDSSSPIVLFLGRTCFDKGVMELLAAFDRLRKRLPEVRLVMVGPTENETRNGVLLDEAYITQHEGVIVAGKTLEPEKFYALADCLCIPSYREGFGSVVIEAAAMGMPAVGSDIYGLCDAIVEGETGLLVPPKDALALEEALFSMMSDLEYATSLGNAARERVHRDFDRTKVVGAVLDDYAERLNGI